MQMPMAQPQQQQQGPADGGMNSVGDGFSSFMNYFKSPGSLLQGYNQLGTTEQMTDRAQQLFSRDNLRSVSDVIGVGEDRAFGCVDLSPNSPKLLLARMKYNMSYFYFNYMVITAVLFLCNIFLSPSAWLGMIVLAVLWVLMINTIVEERMLKAASLAMTLISAIVLYFLLKGAFWWTIYLSGFLIVGHAMFRNTATLEMMHNPTGSHYTNIPPSSGHYESPQISITDNINLGSSQI